MQPNVPSKRSKTTSSVVFDTLTANTHPIVGSVGKPSCNHPKHSPQIQDRSRKSAFHQLNGHKYDLNTFPMAPPGTRAVIYIRVDGRTSWGTREIDAWYCGPSTDHYRNCIFFIPETGSYHIYGSFYLFPQHCLISEFTPIQHTKELLSELTESVQKLNQQSCKKI